VAKPVDLSFNAKPDSFFTKRRAVLKTILSKVLRKERYRFGLKIRSHNAEGTTKYDSIEYLYLFIKIYL
jgi:hypothetical protein